MAGELAPEINLPAPIAEVVRRVYLETLPGSRDRAILDRQVFLRFDNYRQLYQSFTPAAPAYTPGSRPDLEAAASDMAAGCRPGIATALALMRAVSRLTPARGEQAAGTGTDRTEEEILRSGWATPLERARLLAALAQVSALGSRLVLHYREDEPAFHASCELRLMNAWSEFDPLANVYYILPHHPYASAWELKERPMLINQHPEHGRKPTVDASFYRTLAIANYGIPS